LKKVKKNWSNELKRTTLQAVTKIAKTQVTS